MACFRCSMVVRRSPRLFGPSWQGLPNLLQLCVFRLRLFEDGNVRVGIFPKREEILISRLGFGGVALHGVSAGQSYETGSSRLLNEHSEGLSI